MQIGNSGARDFDRSPRRECIRTREYIARARESAISQNPDSSNRKHETFFKTTRTAILRALFMELC